MENLEKHPLVKALREKYGKGENLYFVIPNYEKKVEDGKFPPPDGESLQAVFLKRVLESIFPAAKLSSGPSKSEIGSRTRKFWKVTDSAEMGSGYQWKSAGLHTDTIEMGSLKAVNPGIPAMNKVALRKAMKIPNDGPVNSVYASYWTKGGEILKMVNGLVDKGNVKTIVVSASSKSAMEMFDSLPKSDPKIQYVKASELGRTPLEKDKKYVILNDTRGKMPYIHAASDSTVVLGSPNLFESLNTGTPTVFFRKAESNFDQRTWNDLSELALKTGGAEGVDTVDQAVDFVARPNPPKPARRSYEIED